jgi:hypothetical protein
MVVIKKKDKIQKKKNKWKMEKRKMEEGTKEKGKSKKWVSSIKKLAFFKPDTP